MFRIGITVKLGQETKCTIRPISEESNSESTVTVKGQEATVEFLCDKIPTGIVMRLDCQEQSELHDENGETVCLDAEAEKATEAPASVSGLVPPSEAPTDSKSISAFEAPNADDAVPTPKDSEGPSDEGHDEDLDKETANTLESGENLPKLAESPINPKIMEFAKKADSYEDFIDLIAKWLGMRENSKTRYAFVQAIQSAEKLEKITWNNICRERMENGVTITKSEITMLSIKCKNTESTSGIQVGPMELIKAIVSYKKTYFNHESKEPEKVESSADILECFKEVFKHIDRKSSNNTNLTRVLEAMGLRRKAMLSQMSIMKVAGAAIKPEVDLSAHISEIAYSDRLLFAEFINDYVRESYPGKNNTISVKGFLETLRAAILK